MNNSSTKILIITLFVIAVLSGYNYFQRPFLKFFESQQQEVVEDVPEPTISKEDEIFEKLSVSEKIWQMMSLPITLASEEIASSSSEMSFIYENNPGFITIFGSKVKAESVKDLTKSLPVSDYGYSPLVAVDHEGGTVQRLSGEGFSILPSWSEMCLETTGKRLAFFEESARELRSAGVNIVFAPVIDVPRKGSFLESRACPEQLASLDAAEDYIKSFGSQGILSVAKHYPGIGSLTRDPHFYSDEVYIEPQDTAPFERIFSSFPNIGVMSAHVVVPNRTDDLPCSLSSVCLDPFPNHFPDVMIFTDALEMQSATTQNKNGEDVSLAETSRLAVLAGNNVLVYGDQMSYDEMNEVVDYLVIEYELNDEFKDKVNLSVKKILDVKLID